LEADNQSEAPVDENKKVVEGLDVNGLPDRSKAQQKFTRRPSQLHPSQQGLSSRAEQSYRLPPIRTHTLSSDSETEDERRLESTAAKLRRLRAELAQVEQEIAAGPSNPTRSTTTKRRSVLPPRPAYDLAGELSGLKERLGAIEGQGGRESVKEEEDEWSERLERLKIGGSSAGDTGDPKDAVDETTRAGATYPITDLDKRLARLEAALGSDESNVSLLLPFHQNELIPRPPSYPP
jgi:nuclear migration protein JNM1